MEPTVSGPSSRLSQHVVKAGAGAGKTRSLVEKVVSVFRHFRKEHGRNPRLIVTTFTRKATQELRERLIVRACEEGDAELLDYVGNARALHISTIHGVLQLFLGQVGHLCGLEAGFRTIEDSEERRVARVALKRALLTDAETLAWVEDYSFQNLLSILIQFSKALTQQPRLRPATLADLEAAQKDGVREWRGRLDAIADTILDGHADDEKWNVFAEEMKSFAKVWDGSSGGFENCPKKPRRSPKSPLTEEFQEEIGESLTKLKDDVKKFNEHADLWPYFVEKWDGFFALGRRFHHEFWNAKMSEGLLSMSDLEIFSYNQLLDLPHLSGYFAENWDFWLIDEFQDTSNVQHQLLRHLRGQTPSFVVGDPQQSIYLFRGAQSDVFLQLIAEAKKSDAQVDELMINYRSEPALLEFLNDFFSNYSDQFQPMRPRQPVGGERLAVADFISGPTEEDENNGILAHIFRLLSAGARYDGICILGRTHAHLSGVAAVLKAHGIPVQVHSPDGFWRRREILDAMALLKFLIHPHDNLTLLSLLRSPVFRVEDERLVTVMQSKPKSLWLQLLTEGGDAVERLRALVEFRDEHGVVAAFERGLCESGLLDLISLNDPSGRREANLWKLISHLKGEEKKPGFHPLTLVEEVEGWIGDNETAKKGDAITAREPNCVNLMTIHGSKGLEFEHVIIPRMGAAPNRREQDDFLFHEDAGMFTFRVYLDSEGGRVASPLDRVRLRHLRERKLAEQDRWLYVALTRAKRSLALCWHDDQLENESWAERGRLPAAERFGRSIKYAVSIHRPPFHFEFSLPGSESKHVPRPAWQPKAITSARPQSVTQMTKTKGEKLSIEDLRVRQESAIYGVLLHRVFQSLKAKPDLPSIKSEYPALASAVQYVWDLKAPPLREVVANGFVEWGFKLKTPTGVVPGRIDLWGRANDGTIWIVDYKSGRVKDDDSHWEQLRLYGSALRQFGQAGPMRLALVHPLHKSVLVTDFDA